jgi:predicted MFS family arabinose efflux permease
MGQPLLTQPKFRTWVFGRGISSVGTAVTTAVLPIIAVVTVHASASSVGLIVATNLAAGAIARPVLSIFAENSKSRLGALIIFDLVAAVTVSLVPILWLFDALSLTSFWVLSLLTGLSSGAYGAYAAPVIVSLVDPEELAPANGILQSSSSAASVTGPTIASILLALFAAPLAMFVDGGTYLLGAIASTRLRNLDDDLRVGSDNLHHPNQSGAPEDAPKSLIGAFSAPFQSSRTRRLLTIMLVLTALNGAVLGSFTVFTIRHLHLSPYAVAYVGAAGAAFGVLAGLGIGKYLGRWSSEGLLRFSVLLQAVAIAVLPLAARGPAGIAPCLMYEVLGATGGTIFVTVTFTEIIQALDPAELARGMATAAAIPEVGHTVGAAAAGALLGVCSVTHLVFALALLSLAAGAASWFLSPQVRDRVLERR